MIMAVLFAGVFSFVAKCSPRDFSRHRKFRETGAKSLCGK